MTVLVELADVEQRARSYPDSFEIPGRDDREGLRLDDCAKLVFADRERMWVQIVAVQFRPGKPPLYTGKLVNEPVTLRGLRYGDRLKFEPRHVCAIQWARGRVRRPRSV